MEKNHKYTMAGTDSEVVKEQARKSGLSYNEAKKWIAQQTGGRDTHIYSDTDTDTVRGKNIQSETKKM